MGLLRLKAGHVPRTVSKYLMFLNELNYSSKQQFIEEKHDLISKFVAKNRSGPLVLAELSKSSNDPSEK